MAPPGRPPLFRTVGTILETTIKHWRLCFTLAAAYAALNAIPQAFFGAAAARFGSQASQGDTDQLVAFGITMLFFSAILFAVTVFVYPATVGALSLVGSAAAADEAPDRSAIVSTAVSRALRATGAFLVPVLIVTLAFGVLAVLLVIMVVATGGTDGGNPAIFAVAAIIVIAAAVVAMYVLVRFTLGVAVVMHEDLRISPALSRAWDLVKGSWWWVFGLYVITGLAGAIIGGIFNGLASSGGSPGAFLTQAVATLMAGLITTSVLGVSQGVMYAALSRPPPAPEDVTAEGPVTA